MAEIFLGGGLLAERAVRPSFVRAAPAPFVIAARERLDIVGSKVGHSFYSEGFVQVLNEVGVASAVATFVSDPLAGPAVLRNLDMASTYAFGEMVVHIFLAEDDSTSGGVDMTGKRVFGTKSSPRSINANTSRVNLFLWEVAPWPRFFVKYALENLVAAANRVQVVCSFERLKPS